MWDLNFGTWISHMGFTVAFGHGHPLVSLDALKTYIETPSWLLKMLKQVLEVLLDVLSRKEITHWCQKLK
jgi:hypothetical protein